MSGNVTYTARVADTAGVTPSKIIQADKYILILVAVVLGLKHFSRRYLRDIYLCEYRYHAIFLIDITHNSPSMTMRTRWEIISL